MLGAQAWRGKLMIVVLANSQAKPFIFGKPRIETLSQFGRCRPERLMRRFSMAPGRDINPGVTDRGLHDGHEHAGVPGIYPDASARSDIIAFATGGLMITAGLLTFLYYDGDQLGRHAPTQMANALRFEAPARPVPNIVTARPAQPIRSVTH
jgi:hypothetical protein